MMMAGQVKTADGEPADSSTHREDRFLVDALEEVYNYSILCQTIHHGSQEFGSLADPEIYAMLVLPFPLAWAVYCPKGHTGNRPELELKTDAAKQVK